MALHHPLYSGLPVSSYVPVPAQNHGICTGFDTLSDKYQGNLSGTIMASALNSPEHFHCNAGMVVLYIFKPNQFTTGLFRQAGYMENPYMKCIIRLCCALIILLSLCSTSFAGPTVLFDEGHGQKFMLDKNGPLDLSSFAELFRKAGCELRVQKEPITRTSLAGVDALVISGAFQPFAMEELEAVASFLSKGGRICIMLHIGSPVGSLLQFMGVNYSNGVIHETDNIIMNDPLNFAVTRLEPHPITAGLRQFKLYGAWALMNKSDNAKVIARTSPTAWVDLDGDQKFTAVDVAQSFGVAVAGRFGDGEFAVFGDDAIFQNKFLEDDNLHLANNLVGWLTAAKQPSRSSLTKTGGRVPGV